MNSSQDTIVAIASGQYNSPIGVIRISGSESFQIAKEIFKPFHKLSIDEIKFRYFYYGDILSNDGKILDKSLIVCFKGPQSFTGEDVVEIQTHGNQILLRQIIRQIILLSDKGFDIRAAEAGEFTKRAFLNGKMDLTQAESIHDIIQAESEQVLNSSLKNLDGYLNEKISVLQNSIKKSLSLVEASFEFPEEDIQTYDFQEIVDGLLIIKKELLTLQDSFYTTKLLEEGISVALVGKPNVGKSSFLNALIVEDRAIVTDVAGTTRDVISGEKHINGVKVIFRDTAGIRETSDIVEKQGIERSFDWIQKSDMIFYLTDELNDKDFEKLLLPFSDKPKYKILNKIDELLDIKTELDLESIDSLSFDVYISAKYRLGMTKIELILREFIQNSNSVQNNIHVNERQHINILKSIEIIDKILMNIDLQVIDEEILADDLRYCIQLLQEITGTISSNDVLGEIFSRFCIGK